MGNKSKPSEVALTVIENETDGPAKSVKLRSPWGSEVHVAADQADVQKDAGYKASR